MSNTSKLERVLSIDLRSLALFRVAVALALLADLAMRAPDLVAHYTDAGILPRAAVEAHPVGRVLPYLSLHFANGSALWAGGLFALAGVFALALLLGWRTRLAALGSWLLLVSLQNRNPLVVYGGDNFLAVVLFWCPFLPLGARASLDARAGRGSRAPRVFDVASAGLLLQIAAVHFFSAFHKRGAEWWSEGSAVWYALHVDNLVRPLGLVLREHAALLQAFTWGTLGLELLGSLLLFSPWGFGVLRTATTAAFMGFHLGLALSLRLLLFNWMGAAFMTVFLPPWFWDRALPWLSDRLGLRARFAPPDPGAPSPGLPPAARVLAAFAIVFVLFWNLVSLRPDWQESVERDPVLGWLILPGHLLRIGQRWFMFSPHPPRYTYWNVVEGVLADGRHVDLLHGGTGEPDFGKPASPSDYYPSGRWERVFANATSDPYVHAYRSLAGYWCRQGRAGAPPAPIARVRIWTRREENRPGAAPHVEPARVVATFDCGRSSAARHARQAPRARPHASGRSRIRSPSRTLPAPRSPRE